MNTRTTHGLYPPKARTGDRAGGCALAIPQRTAVSVYLPVGLPAASVAGLFLRPLSVDGPAVSPVHDARGSAAFFRAHQPSAEAWKADTRLHRMARTPLHKALSRECHGSEWERSNLNASRSSDRPALDLLQGTADECVRRAMRHAGGRNAPAPFSALDLHRRAA